MSDDILISFIVPVYNTEKTISKCLDSIIKQTIKNFETLIVLDSCWGQTKEIVLNSNLDLKINFKQYLLFLIYTAPVA
jgi:GT2 family glycosyltransferase